MKRLTTVLVGLALLACGGVVESTSTAAFTYGSTSTVTATANIPYLWLHLYSSASDPDGDTGYATRAGYTPTTPAASGMDDTIAVHVGSWADSKAHDISRVLKLKTPATFPDGLTSVKVTATLVADPATGLQPIAAVGLDTWGASPTWTTTVNSWAASVKRQLDLRVKYTGSWAKRQYIPKVRLTVTHGGSTTVYDIPVKCNYMSATGPD